MAMLPYRRIWGESAFLLACSVATNGALFLAGALVLRHYRDTPAQSDRYFLAVGILSLGTLLANQGVPQATVKLLAAGDAVPGPGRQAILASTSRLMFGYALAAALAMWAYLAADSAQGWSAWESALLCACVLTQAPAKWLSGVLQGMGRIRASGMYETLLDLGRLAAAAGALWAGQGVTGVIQGWALAGAVHLATGAALAFILLRRPAAAYPVPVTAAAPGNPAGLALSLYLPYAGFFAITQGLTLAVAAAGAPGDASRWAVSLQIASLLLAAAAPLGTVLLPHLSRAAAGSADVVAASGPIARRGALLLAGAALFLIVFADPLANRLLPSAGSGVPLCRILTLILLAEACKFLLDPALVARGQWKALAAVEAARLGAVLAFAPWAVARWPVEGAAACLGLAVAISSAGKAGLFLDRPRMSHARV